MKPKKDDPEQSARFEKAAADIEADGGLNPIEAAIRLEKIIGQVASQHRRWLEGEEGPESREQ